MGHCHALHLPLGAPMSPSTVCGAGENAIAYTVDGVGAALGKEFGSFFYLYQARRVRLLAPCV